MTITHDWKKDAVGDGEDVGGRPRALDESGSEEVGGSHPYPLGNCSGSGENGSGQSVKEASLLIEQSRLGGDSDTPGRAVSKSPTRLLHRVLSCLPLSAQLLVTEVCNLPRRIRAAREISAVFSSGSPVLPKGSERFQISGPSSRKHAYSQDMKQLREEFPFLTHLDLSVATLAWKLGTRRSDDTVRIESRRIASQSIRPSQNGSGICTEA